MYILVDVDILNEEDAKNTYIMYYCIYFSRKRKHGVLFILTIGFYLLLDTICRKTAAFKRICSSLQYPTITILPSN